jgi:predicted ATP-binding protein involved in virulence
MEKFPYIESIYVMDCFANKNFHIASNQKSEPFRHFIITGKNGSGKSTILNRIAYVLSLLKSGQNLERLLEIWNKNLQTAKDNETRSNITNRIKETTDVRLNFINGSNSALWSDIYRSVFSFYRAHRKVKFSEVKTYMHDKVFHQILERPLEYELADHLFNQFLVNKKIAEAFDIIDGKNDEIINSRLFFDRLTKVLKRIFKDENIDLLFIKKNFEFNIVLGDGRKITFDQLPEGYSAFLSIIIDLMIRVDLIRENREGNSLNPEGIILIDEPETHLHLSMQYEILSLITELFPRIQLIVATHSPAIISSLSGATIFDLSSKELVEDWSLGSSYSELMIRHFGLENEFSPQADRIIADINKAVINKNSAALKQILEKSEKYLTPSLRLEIESQIRKINISNGL